MPVFGVSFSLHCEHEHMGMYKTPSMTWYADESDPLVAALLVKYKELAAEAVKTASNRVDLY